MSDHRCYSGLGYASSSGPATTSGVKNDDQNIDDLMASYMQQCLQYHHEQTILEQQQPQHQQYDNVPAAPLQLFVSPTTHSTHLNNTNDHDSDKNTTIVPGGNHSGNENIVHFIHAEDQNRHPNENCGGDSHEEEIQKKDNEVATKSDATFQKALAKAKSIAQRFATGNDTTNTNTVPTTINIPTHKVSSENDSYPYAQKRHQFLTQHHAKLKSFLLQNFEYLVERDEAQYQRQMHHLEFIKHSKQQQQQKEKKRKNIPNLSGIGSQSRRKHRNNKKPSGASHNNTPSCGIYITGLPKSTLMTDQEDEEGEELIRTLRGLFGSFGKVSNVKLYRDKLRGGRKGDGLVSYDWDTIRNDQDQPQDSNVKEVDRIQNFLQMVCQQLNGVELPSGTVLNSEPADSNYKYKKRNESPTYSASANTTGAIVANDRLNENEKEKKCNGDVCSATNDNGVNPVPDPKGNQHCDKQNGNEAVGAVENQGDADEDLDDFFASLE